MSVESANFIVQRGAKQFICRGDELKDKLEDGDLMVVQHDNEDQASKWEVESKVIVYWHVKVTAYGPLKLSDINENPGTFKAYDVDGSNVRNISEVQTNEELIFETGADCSHLFDDNDEAEWDILEKTDTTECRNMSYLFADCPYFNSSVQYLNTSKVESFKDMFKYAREFNHPLDHFDTSNVKNMAYMFAQNVFFNQDISMWDVGNVTDFTRMFFSAFRYRGGLSNWNTKSATDMDGMFYVAGQARGDLSQWCVPLIGTEPENFATDSSIEASPVWGTCPRGEDQ